MKTKVNRIPLMMALALLLPAPPAAAEDDAAAAPEPLVKLRKGRTATVDAETGERVVIEYQIYDGPSTFRLSVPPAVVVEELDLGEAKQAELAALRDADPAAYAQEIARMNAEFSALNEAPALAPSFADAKLDATYDLLPSLEFATWRGRFTDDAALATVQLLIEDGVEKTFPRGMQGWLADFTVQCFYRWSEANAQTGPVYRDALLFAATGYLLGGGDLAELNIPSDAIADAEAQAEMFRHSEPVAATPVGPYTWTERLQRAYVRDQWLAQPFDPRSPDQLKVLVALVDAMLLMPELHRELDKLWDLRVGLAGPVHQMTLRDVSAVVADPARTIERERRLEKVAEGLKPGKLVYLLPPAPSRDLALVERLGGIDAVAADTLASTVDAIRSEDVSLLTSAESGWTDVQQFALEAVARLSEMPEGEKLQWDDGYDRRLRVLFAGPVTQARETHVVEPPPGADDAGAAGDGGDAEEGDADAAPEPPRVTVTVRPNFAIEPLPSYYLRLAQTYEFLADTVLDGNLDDRWHDLPLVMLGEPTDTRLPDALQQARDLYMGLYLAAVMDVGMIPDTEALGIQEPRATVGSAVQWLHGFARLTGGDPLMAEDIRTIVPLGVTSGGGLLCHAVLGVKAVDVTIEYVEPPRVTPLVEGVELTTVTEPLHLSMLIPVTAEVLLPSTAPMSTAEFRALCDEQRTEEAILQALTAAP